MTKSEMGRLLHIEGEDTYRFNDSGQPIDDWGEVIPTDAEVESAKRFTVTVRVGGSR